MANDNHYLHRNHLASVKVVSDQNGVPYRQSTYQPFGELNEVVSQTFTPKHDKSYIGERHDPETGLTYLNARNYDPELAHFVQPDWWNPADPAVGTNRYAYSLNDPVNKSVPGWFVAIAGAWIGEQGADLINDGRLNGNWPLAGATKATIDYGINTVKDVFNSDATLAQGDDSQARSSASTKTSTVPEKPKLIMYHYTDERGLAGILASQTLLPSIKAANNNDVRYGNGQYVSDILPGTKRNGQLAYVFKNDGRLGNQFRNFVAIDVSGIVVRYGRKHVYVLPNDKPLDLKGRIVASGRNSEE